MLAALGGGNPGSGRPGSFWGEAGRSKMRGLLEETPLLVSAGPVRYRNRDRFLHVEILLARGVLENLIEIAYFLRVGEDGMVLLTCGGSFDSTQ